MIDYTIIILGDGELNIAIMTCENYNCTDANSVEKEQERTLNVKDYSHVNYEPEKSDRNVILEHDNKIDEYDIQSLYEVL